MSKIPVKEDMEVDIALIDFDVLRYEIGSIQADHPMLPDVKLPAPIAMIHEIVDERVQGILDSVRAKDHIGFVTGPGNFRFEIAQMLPYKGNREDFEKPYHWKTVDEYLRLKYNVVEIRGREADDELAILQRQYLAAGITTAICSRDKDLRMCEGLHYSWACGKTQPEKPLYYIDRMEGIKFFFKQMLTGDSTDNIIGCGKKEESVYKTGKKKGQVYTRRVGVGPAGADKLLSKGVCPADWYNIIRNQYLIVFGLDSERAMLENARLLYIGQTEDKQFDWDWLAVKPFIREAPAITDEMEDQMLDTPADEPQDIYEPELLVEDVSSETEKVQEIISQPEQEDEPV